MPPKNSKSYKKSRHLRREAEADLSPQQLRPPSRVNRAFVELDSKARSVDLGKIAPPTTATSNRALGERTGPPRRENRLPKASETVNSSPAFHVRARSPMPSAHVPSPVHSPPPSALAPLPPVRSHSPPIRSHSPPVRSHSPPARSHSPRVHTPPISPRLFPLDAESPEDNMGRSKQPLFLSDGASQVDDGDGDSLFYDPGVEDEPDEPEEGALSEQDEYAVDDDADEEVVKSMMTGGRFTREQILEVQDLTKSLMTELRQRAKKWRRPLDSVMRIANLIITTKERRVSGNVWNAFQSKYPEDPQKETRKYSCLCVFSTKSDPHASFQVPVISTLLRLLNLHINP